MNHQAVGRRYPPRNCWPSFAHDLSVQSVTLSFQKVLVVMSLLIHRRIISGTGVFGCRRFGGENGKNLLRPFRRSHRQLLPPVLVRQYHNPLTEEEEQKEKDRVSKLTPFQKEMELREHDKEIARLNMLRGINTGELYTLRGKMKALARDYGFPFMAWYWTVWTSTAFLTYGAIQVGGLDAMAVIAWIDSITGFSLASHIDPTVGTIGLTIAVNEILEPLRLPIVVLTTKPVVHALYPRKY